MSRRSRKVLYILMMLALLLPIIGGCAQTPEIEETAEPQEQEQAEEVQPEEQEEAAEVEEAEEPEADEDITIGFAVPVLANPFWNSNAEFAQKTAEELGVELLIGDANSQEDQQVKIVEDFIAQGVDGLILSPVTQAVGPALLQRAEEAGILVVFAERNPGIRPEEYEGDAYVGFVGTDNKAGAIESAEALYAAGARQIVAMTGAQGNSVAELRLEGLLEVAEKYDDMEVLQVEYGQELREDGLATTENFLAAFPGPGFDGVWAFNDETGLGAIEALRQAGVLDQVLVTGLDATEAGVRAIEEGEMLVAPGGHYIDGGLALVMLFDALNGHMPETAWVEMGFLSVDATNADAYAEQFVASLPPYDARDLSKVFNPEASTDDYVIELK